MRNFTSSRHTLYALKPLAVATACALSINVAQSQTLLDMGGNWGRFGVGVSSNGDVHGEVLLRMAPRADQRVILEGFAGEHQALGLKLSYHVVPRVFIMPGVFKGFVAFDRNTDKARKITAGLGGEVGNLFWGAYGSRGMSDGFAGLNALGLPATIRPYDSGLGFRAGSFFDSTLMRVTLGADYEQGKQGARQVTGSLMLEKYLEGSPVSVALNMEMLRRRSDTEVSNDETRGGLTVRVDLQGRSPTVPSTALTRGLDNTVAHKRSVDMYARTAGIAPPPIGNRAPTPTDDVATAVSGGAEILIDVLANDTDPDKDTLTITSVGAAQHGTTRNAAGKVAYTAAANYAGADAFTYTVTDAKGGSATGTVRVTVTAGVAATPSPTPTPAPTATPAPTPAPTSAVNRAPIANADSYTVTAGSTANSFSVLANDTDPDGDVLSVVTLSVPAHGTATISGKVVLYTPAAGYSGADAFTYTVSDGKGANAAGNVAVTVSPTAAPTPSPTPTPTPTPSPTPTAAPGTNQPPKAVDDAFTVNCAKDATTNFVVTTNDSDPDTAAGDQFFVVGFTFPPATQGTLGFLGNGEFKFTASGVAFGSTTFQYALNDTKNASATATVTLRCQ